MELKQLSKARTSELEPGERISTSRKQNPEDSSQNDPGLPEALEALESLIFSSGSQSRNGRADRAGRAGRAGVTGF